MPDLRFRGIVLALSLVRASVRARGCRLLDVIGEFEIAHLIGNIFIRLQSRRHDRGVSLLLRVPAVFDPSRRG